jgi:hypothetical protein
MNKSSFKNLFLLKLLFLFKDFMQIELGSLIAGIATAIGVIAPMVYLVIKRIKLWIENTLQDTITTTVKQEIEKQNKFIDSSLKTLNGTASAIIASYPAPCWVKLAHKMPDGKIEFRMMDLNFHYEVMFGKHRLEYVGKTDLEAGWSQEESDDFYVHDLLVYNDGKPRDFIEKITIDDKQREVVFRKIRLQYANGEVKGIMGYMYEGLSSHEENKAS